MKELKVGDHVQVSTYRSGGGYFRGVVTAVDDSGADIRPGSDDVRRFIGRDTYRLGRAHWAASAREIKTS